MHRFRDMVNYWFNFRCLSLVPLFNAIVRGDYWIRYCKIWSPETRDIPLSYDAKHISISWTAKAWPTSVIDSVDFAIPHFTTLRVQKSAPRTDEGCALESLYCGYTPMTNTGSFYHTVPADKIVGATTLQLVVQTEYWRRIFCCQRLTLILSITCFSNYCIF